jgi:hypothetical protein
MAGKNRRRWTLLGAGLGSMATLAAVLAFGVLAGSGAAASGAPSNTSPPTISGTAQEGQKLHADPGTWDGTAPITYKYQWQRCDSGGGNCADISGATSNDYTLTSADVGNTVRVVVTATNLLGSSTAASAPTAVVAGLNAPSATSPPTISGTPQLGQTLTANTGTWKTTGTVTFTYQWLRCDASGAACVAIKDATKQTYVLTQDDVGHTIRVQVTAKDANGTTSATSVPTGVVSATANGCPIGARTLSVASVAPPARLTIDQQRYSPSVATKSTTTIVARFHVAVCGGQSAQGALVYATAVPYNQFNNAPEVTTDATGWATITFHRMKGFPTSRNQQLIAFFVRARKPGEDVLGGISTRRLVQMPVAR